MKEHTPLEFRVYCDEAGRGPLAGPVTVGCVVSLRKCDMSFFKDSKQLTAKKRNAAYDQLHTYEQMNCLLASTGRASAQEIDRYGIIKAIQSATIRGIWELLKKVYLGERRELLLRSDRGEDILAVRLFDILLSHTKPTAKLIQDVSMIPQSAMKFSGLIRDGNHTFELDRVLGRTVVTITKGDQKNPYISAASIAAKVERDRRMQKIHTRFSVYGFDQHKGYGTVVHRKAIEHAGLSPLHRVSFCKSFVTESTSTPSSKKAPHQLPKRKVDVSFLSVVQKPNLLLHICCAPDLSRPLHRLKEHFKLHLFRYNPNIHPRKEHEQRYAQFLKLTGLEKGDYEILEDRYDPKEFFDAMMEQRVTIHPSLEHAPKRQVLQVAGEMEERSDRCNPCYAMRLEAAARMAAKAGIQYFTSTLLISPKKKMDKLYRWGKEAETKHPSTKFLWFDFAKNDGYHHAVKLTKKHGLRRQHYCGCGRTIPKDGKIHTGYQGG